MSAFRRGPCITDDHDVTEEDFHYANFGSDEELVRAELFNLKPRVFHGRSKEWIKQYNTSRMRGPKE